MLTIGKKRSILPLFVIILVSVIWLSATLLPVRAQSAAAGAVVVEIKGALTPSLAEYLERGLIIAQEEGAELVIVQLNTPGGSVDLMTRMVEAIRGSAVPVVVFVAPRGAIAGSAGTVITLAGHLAAMSPETSIGAASPVGAEGEDIGGTMEAKLKEILKAQIRSLAEDRSPEAVALADLAGSPAIVTCKP